MKTVTVKNAWSENTFHPVGGVKWEMYPAGPVSFTMADSTVAGTRLMVCNTAYLCQRAALCKLSEDDLPLVGIVLHSVQLPGQILHTQAR